MNPTKQKPTAPETRRKREKILYSAAVVLLFGLFAFQLWFHAVRASATFDEPIHTAAGYRYWQCGDYGRAEKSGGDVSRKNYQNDNSVEYPEGDILKEQFS
ncbi:MAG: hypothetical protein LH472_05980 [Pyrinomonadaceae bacterium]|nr:hypothetical protein [Pyrinomonadaceae bacterium]